MGEVIGQQQMVEIEMPSRHNNSGGNYSTSRPGVEIEMSSSNNTSRPETLQPSIEDFFDRGVVSGVQEWLYKMLGDKT